MPRATAGSLEIEYQTFGARSKPAVLLVMGLAYQMIEWDDVVCRRLADRGFWVIRYDNRDVGLSSKLDELGVPDLLAMLMGTEPPPYTLDDMASDSVGLLDALGVDSAHLVGVSMGGMIAQLIAINHPTRVRTLTSVMSTVGGPGVVQADAHVTEALLLPPGPTREERVDGSVEMRRIINGAGLPFDEGANRRKAERAVDRSFHPDGIVRQLAAIVAAPDRSQALSRLTIPTLVIHGDQDPLVPPDNGRQTAAALPSPRVLMFEAMGHNLPEWVWPAVLDAIVDLTTSATPAERRRGVSERRLVQSAYSGTHESIDGGTGMSGDADRVAGRVKQAAGDLTGDSDLKGEGQLQETAGDVKKAGAKLGDKVKETADQVGDKLKP